MDGKDPVSSTSAESAPAVPAIESSEEFGLKSALGMIATTICVVMAVAVILGAVGSALGFYRADTVLSGSMRPSYPEGSVVVATRQDSHKLAVGQVIIFTAPAPYGEVVTHRVQSVTLDKKTSQPLVTTKGDNNPAADPWKALVPADEVWVVKGRIPVLGWVANWAFKWWPLLLGFVVAVPMVSFTGKRIRESGGTAPEPVDPGTDSEAAPVPQAVPRSVLSRSLTLIWLLPIAGVMGGAYMVAASGAGGAIAQSARKFAAEQPRNVNDSASGRGRQAAAPTASPATSTPRPGLLPGATRPTSPTLTPAPTPSVAKGPEILAMGVATLELKAGAAGKVAIIANAKQEVAQQMVDVVNAGATTIQAIRGSATAQSPTSRRLTVKVCASQWKNIRGQAACPGAKYSVISQSQVPTSSISSILAPRPPLEPHQPLHLLLELRSPYGAPVAGPRAHVTLHLDAGRSR